MFYRSLIVVLCALFLGIGIEFSRAQDRAADYAVAVKADCAKELKTRCKGVREGGGRMLACLYSHDDKVSAKCAATISMSAVRLGEALGALANVRRVCDGDARRLCSGVMPGDGNLIDCLAQARKGVSQACNATLDAAFLRP